MPKMFQTIAFRTIAFVVSSCVLLATAVSLLGDRAGREIAQKGVSALAEVQTLGLADQLLGPIRFKRFEDVGTVLADAQALSDFSKDAAVVVQSGEVFSNPEATLSDTALAELSAAATEAIQTETIVRSAGGLLVAIPIRKSPSDPVVGAVATSWTSAPLFATVAFYGQIQIIGAAVALLAIVVLSALALRSTIGAPMTRIERRALAMADGELDVEVPETHRKGEIGVLAQSMEHLRRVLHRAKEEAETAFYESAGFKASSAAQLLCDQNFVIASTNAEFERFKSDLGMAEPVPAGAKIDALQVPALNAGDLAKLEFPARLEVAFGDKTLAVSIKTVRDRGETKGYVLEIRDMTQQKIREGVLNALEEGLMRLDFARDGGLISASDHTSKLLGAVQGSMDGMIQLEDGANARQALEEGRPYFGRLAVMTATSKRIWDGSVSPIKEADGRVSRYVVLGSDVTQAEKQLEAARTQAEDMEASRLRVVSDLKDAMQALSSGALATRISETFPKEFEALKADFNSAVSTLDDAIGSVLRGNTQITGEIKAVSNAVQNFASRTEQQAATLDEVTGAISSLGDAVAASSENARTTQKVVLDARDQAASSSAIVNDATDAMNRIEASSSKISSIINVIDEIAFQTNLLALNAGVEAARAGEAGRGFAVVATEVRALAQRSAEAASEISQLISSSGQQVEIGVTLVRKAGDALNHIGGAIGSVVEKVEEITGASETQSHKFDQVNQLMRELDQMTQQNAAMFEETAASIKLLEGQTESLNEATAGFEISQPNAQVLGQPLKLAS